MRLEISPRLDCREGSIPFTIPSTGQSAETIFKVYGDLKSGKPPLIVLHGGPGFGWDYLIPLKDLWYEHSIPIVFYDQVGGGRSTHFPEKKGDIGFWSFDLFVAELENVISNLKIEEYDLIGHSWGVSLALEFVLRKQPTSLQHLILYSGLVSGKLWQAVQKEALKQFPQYIQDAVAKGEEDGNYDDPNYQMALQAFYRKHVCRIDPWPLEFVETLRWAETDPTVYSTLQGPSEFTMTGPLLAFDVIDQLHRITYPTFLLNGEFDEASDATQQPMFKAIPHVRWITLKGCSHVSTLEDPQRVNKVVADFLQ